MSKETTACQFAFLLVLFMFGEHSSVSELHVHKLSDFVYAKEVPFNIILDISVRNVSRWKVLIRGTTGHNNGEEGTDRQETEGEGDMNYVSFTMSWKRVGDAFIYVLLQDLESERIWERGAHFKLASLQQLFFQLSNPRLNHLMAEVDVSQGIVQEVLRWAVVQFSHTERISPTNVLQAVVWLNFNPHHIGKCLKGQEVCERDSSWHSVYYITVEWEKGLFLFAVKMEAQDGKLSLLHAQPVPEELWNDKQTFSDMVEEGTCASNESQIDEDLHPWEVLGGRITEQQVADQASLAAWSRYCNRVTIVNNQLHVEFAKQDQEHEPIAHGKKWYTSMLLETLLSLLARVRIPDVDLCVAEETPQTLRGSLLPSLAITKSPAHMDILMPDLFFRYWDTPASLVPHPWYLPPYNWLNLRGRDERYKRWEDRRAKVYWRGSIDDWFMSSRGRLCRVACHRPDIFDVVPIRIIGPALEQEIEEAHFFREARERKGEGEAVEPTEVLSYKFVINTHGNGNEWNNRFRSLLSSGALVFKQEATLFEMWEHELEPYKHFVPIKSDLSDLVEKVEWALANDEKAKQIAENAVEFVRERLTTSRVLCYWAALLTRYAKLQNHRPSPPPSSSHVRNFGVDLWSGEQRG